MSANTILRLDNRFDDYVIQNGYDNTKFMNVLHISSDPTYYCNRKLFISVKGTEHAPVPLQGVDFKAFRNVKFAGDYIYVIMYEIEPKMGRTWVAKCYNNEKYDWVRYKDNLVWLDISSPYENKYGRHLDLSCYEGIRIYGNINSRLNLLDEAVDINIHCRFISINDQSRSSTSFNFINLNPIYNLLGINNIELESIAYSTVILENATELDITNLGYTGLFINKKPTVDYLELSRAHNNNGDVGSWPTSNTSIYNTTYTYHVFIKNAKCSW